jgi:C1A family cysteine protease
MTDTYIKKGLGYLRSLNSHRDYSPQSEKVVDIFAQVPKLQLVLSKVEATNSTFLDRRFEFSPIRDQGKLSSCTAFSASGLVEYFEKKAYNTYTPISTRFTYKTTRNLLKFTGDTGAYLRTVMGSIALFGSPPEEYWEYNGASEEQNPDFDLEPTAFCYAFGQSYQSIKYVRLDQPEVDPNKLVTILKEYINKEFPSMFGFSCFQSLSQSNTNRGSIPFPTETERIIGGHAMVIAGYDDNKKIVNQLNNSETIGAFLIRNSWGTEWGEGGYGWIPYEYFYQRLADDCWTIISQEWVNHISFQE